MGVSVPYNTKTNLFSFHTEVNMKKQLIFAVLLVSISIISISLFKRNDVSMQQQNVNIDAKSPGGAQLPGKFSKPRKHIVESSLHEGGISLEVPMQSRGAQAMAPREKKSPMAEPNRGFDPKERKDLKNEPPKNLSRAIVRYKDQPTTANTPLYDSLNALCGMSRDGDHDATKELINLSYVFDDDKVQHQVLQTLGQTNIPETTGALFDALQRNLNNPVDVSRITSYFPLSTNGSLDPSTVDRLVSVADQAEVGTDVRESILNSVYYKGGFYGRQQVRSTSGGFQPGRVAKH
jgi:hypothetical protein